MLEPYHVTLYANWVADGCFDDLPELTLDEYLQIQDRLSYMVDELLRKSRRFTRRWMEGQSGR